MYSSLDRLQNNLILFWKGQDFSKKQIFFKGMKHIHTALYILQLSIIECCFQVNSIQFLPTALVYILLNINQINNAPQI